jgi:hypothetical protein
MLYPLLNVALLVFHTALILFNLFGYLHHKTRKLNLFTLLLTGFSWFVLGIFYGWGYCALTDWHYQVLHHLGYTHLPASYISYLLSLAGISIKQNIVDIFTVASYFIALSLSIITNFSNKFKTVVL